MTNLSVPMIWQLSVIKCHQHQAQMSKIKEICFIKLNFIMVLYNYQGIDTGSLVMGTKTGGCYFNRL